MPRHTSALVAMLTLAAVLTGCSSPTAPAAGTAPASATSAGTTTPSSSAPPSRQVLSRNVYAQAGPDLLAPVAAAAKPLVYVPNTLSNTVQVIDPTTFKVIRRTRVGTEPQHVVPSWDLKTLWVNSDQGNVLTPYDPLTGMAGKPVPVEDPYNLYFTPDGRYALVMAERLHRIDVRDPHTWKLVRSLPVPCSGVNHADYSADLTFFVASCEFGGKILVVDREATKVVKVIDPAASRAPGVLSPAEAMKHATMHANKVMGATAMPQDVRLTPDGRFFLVADMFRNGLWVIDATTTTVARFLPLGRGTHGIYPSRDAQRIFVSNRDEGSISVLDARTLRVVATWRLPGGGSPDMGGVSADGRTLWLSGRYHACVYVIDTTSGKLLHKIPVDAGAHGLAVWPQPGRFSLGHTGNMR